MKQTVIILMVLFVFFSCGGGKNAADSSGDDQVVTLRFDHLRFPTFLDSVVERFNSQSKGIYIENNNFGDFDEEMKEKRRAEIFSGEGPDILVEAFYSRVTNSWAEITSGIYCDLNELLEGDEDIDITDSNKYFQEVLDAGVFGGKRFLIPFIFNVAGFFVLEESIEEYKLIEEDSDWSWGRMEAITEELSKYSDGGGPALFSNHADALLWDYLLFALIKPVPMTGEGGDDREITAWKIEIDRDRMIRVLDFLKSIKPLTAAEEESGSDYLGKNYILYRATLLCPNAIRSNEIKYSRLGGTFHYLPLPVPGKKTGFVTRPNAAIGILSKCREKEEAFEFIKFLLRPEILGNSKFAELYLGMPVNKEAFERIKEEPYATRLTEEEWQRFELFNEHLSGTLLRDLGIREMVREELFRFYKEDMSSESFLSHIEQKINKYLTK